jgi:4-hydroxy-tetrahydrodipicolinate synthase
VGIQIKDMIKKCLDGRFAEAARVHRYLLTLVNALFIVSNPVPMKWALNYVGFSVGKPRLPLVELDEKSADLIKATLRNYKIDLLISRS